jgi:hypothetical protein
VIATGRPVAACTRPGAALASAVKMFGAMYQPVRVRRLTAIGLSQLSALPSGAFTLKAR